jgi:hypothetical protein
MKPVRITLCTTALAAAALVLPAGVAGALQTPTTGQPGARNGVTCGSPGATATPGNSANSHGSPFNPNVVKFYAGNPGSASLAHSNSSAAVSEYDVACLRQTTNHP